MARNEAKIRFTAETRDLTEQLKSANSSLSALRAGLKLNDAELRNNGNQTEYLKNKQTLLKAELEINAQKQQALTGKLEAAKSIYGENSNEVSNWTTKLTQAKTEQQNLEAELRECGETVEDVGNKANESANGGWSILNQVVADLASNALQNAIEKVKEFARETVNSGIDFTSSMSNVQALSGATTEEMALLEKSARDLGASTIFSATDVSDAFGYMALAGWKSEEMLNGVNGVLNLAAASNMDLAKASDIVTDYLTAFGLEAEDAGGFVDQMAYAMSHSNTNVEQLGEAYKNVAATAASLGFSVEDTTAVLMTMADAGVKGGEAGTGLNAIMTRLATDTKSCASDLKEYGVSVYDAEGNMNDLSTILEGVRGVWSSLSTEQQASLAKTIAGQSHYSQFATIMKGLQEGTDGASSSFRENTEALDQVRIASENGQSAAQDMANTMQDNLGGDIKSLGSAIDELKLKIFDGIQEPMRETVQFITGSVIPAATLTLQFIQQHSTAIGVLAGVIALIVTGIGLYNAVQAVKAAMNAAEAASLGALIIAQISATATAWAAVLPYIAIVAAIAAVIAIIVICVTHWDQIKQAVIEAAQMACTNATAAWNKLMADLGSITESIKSAMQTGWQTIKDNIITPVQDMYSNVTQKISDLRDKVQSTFESIREKMESPIQTAKSTIDGIISTIKGWFPLSIGRIIDDIKLPHFSISGEFSINPPSVPHFDIDWYAAGAIFDAPTLIPTMYGLKGVGEAGPEAVSPISVLQRYVGAAVQRFVPQIDYDLLGQKVAGACAKLGISIELDKRQLGRVVREVV